MQRIISVQRDARGWLTEIVVQLEDRIYRCRPHDAGGGGYRLDSREWTGHELGNVHAKLLSLGPAHVEDTPDTVVRALRLALAGSG